jgi:hypothetical protein
MPVVSTQLRRRRVRFGLGCFLLLLGSSCGMICFLRPRPQVNQVYFSRVGTIWFENTVMSLGFFCGFLGLAMMVEAMLSARRARRRR